MGPLAEATILLLASALLPLSVHGECNRHPPAAPTIDCSASDTVCLVPREENGTISYEELEDPMENTRICYRTCIDDESSFYDRCDATATNVYHQRLKKEPNTAGYSLQRIFSPNYLDRKGYRKSTVCRYNVKCAKNQLLSYSFITHHLEGRGRCHRANKCLDRLTIELPNYGNYILTTCAREIPTDEIFQDGLDELNVQFTTNRKNQFPGFYVFVWCVDQGLQLGPTPHVVRQRDADHGSLPDCALTPTDIESGNVRRKRLANSIRKRTPKHLRTTRKVAYSQVIVENGEWVSYSNQTITITREGAGPEYTRNYTCVSNLLVSHRFTKHMFDDRQGRRYSGYGTLLFYETHTGYIFAHFHQEGVNPATRPTNEEKKLIAELQRGLVKAFHHEHFDVWDSLDENNTFTYPRGRNHADPHLPELALTYGRACNSQLRAVACAYQDIVLHLDCFTGQSLPHFEHEYVTFDELPATEQDSA